MAALLMITERTGKALRTPARDAMLSHATTSIGRGWDFPLIAYHFQKESIAPAGWIPIFYAVAMGVDALAALLFGRLFDRTGIGILAVVSLISSLFAPLVFPGGFHLALAGMALWGVGMGAQESIMRAAVAGMAPAHRRGSAYGLFNAGYGLFWSLGSALMGLLYDVSIGSLIVFSVTMQLASIPLILLTRRMARSAGI